MLSLIRSFINRSIRCNMYWILTQHSLQLSVYKCIV